MTYGKIKIMNIFISKYSVCMLNGTIIEWSHTKMTRKILRKLKRLDIVYIDIYVNKKKKKYRFFFKDAMNSNTIEKINNQKAKL